MKLDIKIEWGPAGKCPVQAKGTINGHQFYFRSRGAHWALRVSSKGCEDVDPLEDKNAWYHREEYNGIHSRRDAEINDGQKFAAGWAEDGECRDAIKRFAELWLKSQEATK